MTIPGPEPEPDPAPGRPRMRAGDDDRQAAVDRLTEHFTAGRLTPTEYDERVQQAYASTYQDELPTLLADLPDERFGAGFAGRRGGSTWQRVVGDDGADDAARFGGDEASWRGGNRWAGQGFDRRTGPWYGAGYRPGDRWRPGRGGPRHRPPFAVLPVIAVVALLIVLTHGFVLIPVFWIAMAFLFFGRHRGGCGRRFGPRSSP